MKEIVALVSNNARMTEVSAVGLVIGWSSRGLTSEKTKNWPRLEPDGRAKDKGASLAKKREAFQEEIGKGQTPYMAVLTRVHVWNLATEKFELQCRGPAETPALKLLECIQEITKRESFPDSLTQDFPPKRRCLLFGFGIRECLKIMAAECIQHGEQPPVRLWRDNKWAFDPFDECVSYDCRHKKVSYERVFEVAGIEVPADYQGGLFVPHQFPQHDVALAKQLVSKYGLVGWF